MSISPISSIPLSISTPTDTVRTQNGLLQTQISEFGLKDQIKLSKEAVALLLGGGAAPAAK